jgi:hypothetical protein
MHAKQKWSIVYLATGLTPSKSVSHIFGNWLHFLDDKMKRITMAGWPHYVRSYGDIETIYYLKH